MKDRNLLIIIIFLLIHLVSAFVSPIVHELTPATEVQALVYTKLVCLIAGTLYILNILGINIGKVKRTFKSDLKGLFTWIVIGVVATVLLQWITLLIESHLFQVVSDPESKAHTLKLIQSNWLAILSPVLFAPLLEEIVFRKAIFGSMYEKTNFLIASVLSSGLFALAHFNITHMITYFVIGMALSCLYVKTNRLIVPIIVHMTLNALPVIAMILLN